jgi:hypothetical protein
MEKHLLSPVATRTATPAFELVPHLDAEVEAVGEHVFLATRHGADAVELRIGNVVGIGDPVDEW